MDVATGARQGARHDLQRVVGGRNGAPDVLHFAASSSAGKRSTHAELPVMLDTLDSRGPLGVHVHEEVWIERDDAERAGRQRVFLPSVDRASGVLILSARYRSTRRRLDISETIIVRRYYMGLWEVIYQYFLEVHCSTGSS